MINAAIIGLGVGEKHIAGYELHPSCTVKTLCDSSDTKRSEMSAKYPHLQIVKDVDAIWNDDSIQVVSIASYDNFHFEHLKSAILSGKHVFIEKPVCLYEEEAAKIQGLLKKHPNLHLSSNLVLRRCPRFIETREWVTQGKFGEVYNVEADYLYGRVEKLTHGWRSEIPYYSVIHGGAIHMVDLITWTLGEYPVEVCAYGNKFATRNSPFRYPDMVSGLLKFPSGRIAKVSANMGCIHPHFHAFAIYGTKGTFFNGNPYGKWHESKTAAPVDVKTPYPGVQKGDIIPTFIDQILGKGTCSVTRDEVLRVMSVCLALEKSVQLKNPVSVEYY